MAFKKGHAPMGGRPKGSITKPRFSDFLKEGDLDKVIAKALQMALSGNEGMLKLVIEQSLGKAIQPTDITTQGEKIIQPLTDLNALLSNNIPQTNSPAPKEN